LLNLFMMRGSLFPASFVVAGPTAVITFLVKWYDLFGKEDVLFNSAAWSGFSFLVGFLVIFRTSEAYSRFWDGCTATHQMRAEWIDAATAIMSFCQHSVAPQEQIVRFKHVTVRLFSLLHAMALGEIEECEDLEQVMAYNLELIDPCGLDKESWRTLQQCHNKVTLVFTWLQTVIVENIKTGVLSIPPPILSRVFQELANGMVALHEARKITNVPFPFPYAQTCDALLFLHWIITPVVTAQWAANATWAAVFSFIQVFILWALNNIAVEIEHPFGDDANDLDACEMQLDMNMSLLLVLHPAATRAPMLSQEARIHNLVTMGRRASEALSTQNTYNNVIESGHATSEETKRNTRRGSERQTPPSEQRISFEDRLQRHSAFWNASASAGGGSDTDNLSPVSSTCEKEQALEVSSTPDAYFLHMDPRCSLPVAEDLHGDLDPAPNKSPRSPRCSGTGSLVDIEAAQSLADADGGPRSAGHPLPGRGCGAQPAPAAAAIQRPHRGDASPRDNGYTCLVDRGYLDTDERSPPMRPSSSKFRAQLSAQMAANRAVAAAAVESRV